MTTFATQTTVDVHNSVSQHFTGSCDTTRTYHTSSVLSATTSTTNFNSITELPQMKQGTRII